MNKDALYIVEQPKYVCPVHGVLAPEHTIFSNIPSHSGVWCACCWLESLGPSLKKVGAE